METASLIPMINLSMLLVQLIRTRTSFGVTTVISPDTPGQHVGSFMDARVYLVGVGVYLAVGLDTLVVNGEILGHIILL